jgi:hypothetical protein
MLKSAMQAVGACAVVAGLAAACASPPEEPPSSASVGCTAGDAQGCATGTIVSPAGTQADVSVGDADGLTGELTAAWATGTLQCDEYTTSSDELAFNFTVTDGTPTPAMTKVVTISGPAPDARPATDYQVCFKAPYDFPALLPSQLAADFGAGDFTGNTQPDGTDFKGLLLPCSAGYGVPCLLGRNVSAGVVSISVATPIGDPRLRF